MVRKRTNESWGTKREGLGDWGKFWRGRYLHKWRCWWGFNAKPPVSLASINISISFTDFSGGYRQVISILYSGDKSLSSSFSSQLSPCQLSCHRSPLVSSRRSKPCFQVKIFKHTLIVLSWTLKPWFQIEIVTFQFCFFEQPREIFASLVPWASGLGTLVQLSFAFLWNISPLLRSDFPVKGHPYTFAMPAIFRWSDFLKTSDGWRFTKATTEGKHYVQVSIIYEKKCGMCNFLDH